MLHLDVEGPDHLYVGDDSIAVASPDVDFLLDGGRHVGAVIEIAAKRRPRRHPFPHVALLVGMAHVVVHTAKGPAVDGDEVAHVGLPFGRCLERLRGEDSARHHAVVGVLLGTAAACEHRSSERGAENGRGLSERSAVEVNRHPCYSEK